MNHVAVKACSHSNHLFREACLYFSRKLLLAISGLVLVNLIRSIPYSIAPNKRYNT